MEKWCDRDKSTHRSMLVRSDPRSLAEYMGGRLTLLRLLTVNSDGVAFLIDRHGSKTKRVSVAAIERLPPTYLPSRDAMHDESLRPKWNIVPQWFLLDADWSGKRIADVERRFLNVCGFAHFTNPKLTKNLPAGLLDYRYDRGHAIAVAFGRMRAAVPEDQRPKSAGVAANSPGVLTMESPKGIASRLTTTLRNMPDTVRLYADVYAWSRIKPEKATSDMPHAAAALRDIEALCDALDVALRVLLPQNEVNDKSAILTAGKLVASYWRQLWKLYRGVDGADFISAGLDPQRILPLDMVQDEDDDEGQ